MRRVKFADEPKVSVENYPTVSINGKSVPSQYYEAPILLEKDIPVILRTEPAWLTELSVLIKMKTWLRKTLKVVVHAGENRW